MKKNTKLKPGEFQAKKAANQDRQKLYDNVKFAIECKKSALNHTFIIDGHTVITSIHDYWADREVTENYAIIKTKNGVGLARINSHESPITATFVGGDVTITIHQKDIKIWCASVFTDPGPNKEYLYDRSE